MNKDTLEVFHLLCAFEGEENVQFMVNGTPLLIRDITEDGFSFTAPEGQVFQEAQKIIGQLCFPEREPNDAQCIVQTVADNQVSIRLLSLAITNQRNNFRVRYPKTFHPNLFVGSYRLRVIDLSLEGIRFQLPPTDMATPVQLKQMISGSLVFSHRSSIDTIEALHIHGMIIRLTSQEAVIRLYEDHHISSAYVLSEQRLVLQRERRLAQRKVSDNKEEQPNIETESKSSFLKRLGQWLNH